MRYDVSLTIGYDYGTPSDHARSLFRILPHDVADNQRVLSRNLVIDPLPAERRDGTDFFGNETTAAAWHDPIAAFSVSLQAQIERFPPATGLDISPGVAGLAGELAATRDIGPLSPHHFSAPSRRAPGGSDLAAFARGCLVPGQSTLETVAAIGAALYGEMIFDPEATSVDTPAQEAFANRKGVCQDFTHIMIGCLRGVGIPAGYVSGFLRTDPPPGQQKLEGADAMHAWVRAWVGADMGWTEYDPTNGRASGTDHLTVGHGRDYDDVAPVLGAMRGLGTHSTTQAVDVVALGGEDLSSAW